MLLIFNISDQHLKKLSWFIRLSILQLIKEIYVNHKYFDFEIHENGGMQINQGKLLKEGFGAKSNS